MYPLFLMDISSIFNGEYGDEESFSSTVVHHGFLHPPEIQDWRVTPPRAGPCCPRNATGCPKSRPWRPGNDGGNMMKLMIFVRQESIVTIDHDSYQVYEII